MIEIELYKIFQSDRNRREFGKKEKLFDKFAGMAIFSSSVRAKSLNNIVRFLC